MTSTINDTIPDRSRPGSTTTAPAVTAQQGGGDKYITAGQNIKLTKHTCTVGTWNVRTLHQEGKLRELLIEMERYEWNILDIAEMRWTKNGEHLMEDGHKI